MTTTRRPRHASALSPTHAAHTAGPWRGLSVFGTIIASLALAQLACAQAFVLLDYKNIPEVLADSHFRMGNGYDVTMPYRGSDGMPFNVYYAIDDDFLSNQPIEVQNTVVAAIESALQTWSDANAGFIQFVPVIWDAVPNDDCACNGVSCPQFNINQCPTNDGDCCDRVLKPFYIGPSLAEWEAGGGIGGWDPLPEGDVWPGWGGDIDFFSRPAGFTIQSNSFVYTMDPCLLGFAVAHRSSNRIWSFDIYINEDWDWTTDFDAADQSWGSAPVIHDLITCEVQHGDHEPRPASHLAPGGVSRPPTARGNCGVPAGTLFDVETVVLHEIGHTLGLDHPNEAGQHTNIAFIEPWQFQFDEVVPTSDQIVMHGVYSGPKRTLDPEDIGGLTFLYPPALWGDLDSDGALTIGDALRALAFAEGAASPNPFELYLLDFQNRNGLVDLDEAAQVMLWVFDAANNPPGELPGQGSTATVMPPTQITVNAIPDPADLGLGGTVDITISLDNPDARALLGWDIELVYDTAILSNPVVSGGTILPGGFALDPGPDDGRITIGTLSPVTSDTSTSGTLAVVTFDIDLPAAVSAINVDAMLENIIITVADPWTHNFALHPSFPEESLFQSDASAFVSVFDGDGSGAVNAEDAYALFELGVDVNRDSGFDQDDVDAYFAATRANETADISSATITFE